MQKRVRLYGPTKTYKQRNSRNFHYTRALLTNNNLKLINKKSTRRVIFTFSFSFHPFCIIFLFSRSVSVITSILHTTMENVKPFLDRDIVGICAYLSKYFELYINAHGADLNRSEVKTFHVFFPKLLMYIFGSPTYK